MFQGGGQHLAVPRGAGVALGRSRSWAPEASGILADEPSVSHHHAYVEHAEDGTAWVTEVRQGATNGTRVNDRVLLPGAREQLHEGDTVWLGPRAGFLVRGIAPPPQPGAGGPRPAPPDDSPARPGAT